MAERKFFGKETELDAGYEIVLFDGESTLTTIEGPNELASQNGVWEKVSEITTLAMNGHIGFGIALSERWNSIRPTRKQLEALGQRYIENLVPDAKAVVEALRFLGKKVCLVSGGIDIPINILGAHLGIPPANIAANTLRFDRDGNYQGVDCSNPLSRDRGKQEVTKKFSGGKRAVFVGDAVTDLEAGADLFIGFGGVSVRPAVRERSIIYLQTATLAPVLALTTTPGEFERLLTRFRDVAERGRAARLNPKCVTIAPYDTVVRDLARDRGITDDRAWEMLWEER